ncbi:MAG: hypothetical protein KAR20_11180 [Candidatus Heimdallarchaeota archaeon]|nr:hypothetical protein [Candidatus Heimdallarchaeota archaeon]
MRIKHLFIVLPYLVNAFLFLHLYFIHFDDKHNYIYIIFALVLFSLSIFFHKYIKYRERIITKTSKFAEPVLRQRDNPSNADYKAETDADLITESKPVPEK